LDKDRLFDNKTVVKAFDDLFEAFGEPALSQRLQGLLSLLNEYSFKNSEEKAEALAKFSSAVVDCNGPLLGWLGGAAISISAQVDAAIAASIETFRSKLSATDTGNDTSKVL